MSFWQREKEKDSCPTTTYNISNKTAWYPKEMIFPSSLSAFHLPFIHQSLRWHFMVNVPSFYFHALPLCTTLCQLIYWSYFYQTRKIHLTFYEPQKSSVAPNVVNRSSEKKKHWRNSKKRRNQGDDAWRQGFQQQANKVTGSTGSYFLSAEKDAEHFSYLICVWDAASGWESSDNLVLGGDSLRIFFLQIPRNTKLHLDIIDLDLLCAQQTGQILTH